MIFLPFGLRPGVMVKWSKIFDHDHGQNFEITVVKWSKLAIFDHDHGQNFKIAVVKWSKFVNFINTCGSSRDPGNLRILMADKKPQER